MRGFLWLMAGIGVLAIVAMGMESPQDRACRSEKAAYEQAVDSVERRLKSPATAEWLRHREADIQKTRDGECTYRVAAYVDSQNGFGAMVRSQFIVRVEYLKDESRWVTHKVTL